MKTKILRKFLARKVTGGHCDLCGKFALLGLRIGKGLVCFNCIRLMMMYLGRQFDISFLMSKKPRRLKYVSRERYAKRYPIEEEESEDDYEREFNVKKARRLNRHALSNKDLQQMREGSSLVPAKKKKKKVVVSGFDWLDSPE